MLYLKIPEILKVNYIYLFHIFIVAFLIIYQTLPLILYKGAILDEMNKEYPFYKYNTYILYTLSIIMIFYHIFRIRYIK